MDATSTKLLAMVLDDARETRERVHSFGHIPRDVKRCAATVVTKLEEAEMWERRLWDEVRKHEVEVQATDSFMSAASGSGPLGY